MNLQLSEGLWNGTPVVDVFRTGEINQSPIASKALM